MSLTNLFKSFSVFTLMAVFAFGLVVVPAASAAPNSGGVVPAVPQDNGDEGKCFHITNAADKKYCLTSLMNTQKKKCDAFKAKKETAKYTACVKTLKNQGVRLKATNDRLKKQLAAAKKVKAPKDYAQCMTKELATTDPAKLKAKINKSVATRTKAVDTLLTQVDGFKNADAKGVMTQALNNDKLALALYQKAAEGTDQPSELKRIYCESIFKLQINNFRKTQIKMLKNVDKQQNWDLARQKLYNDPWNLSTNANIVDNALKSDITSRLDQARELTRANLIGVTTAYIQTASAKVTPTVAGTETNEDGEVVDQGEITNFTSDLSSPKNILILAKANRASAYHQYNEAQALRKVQNDYSPDQRSNMKLVSIVLQNENGDTIKSDGKVVVKSKQVKKDRKTKVEGKCADLKKPSKERKRCLDKHYGEAADGDRIEIGTPASTKSTPNKPRTAYVKVTVGGKESTTKLVKTGDTKAWGVSRTEN